MANKLKKGPVSLLPPSTKQVRSETQPATRNTPVWVFGRVDLRGPWCWSRLDSAELLHILERFKNLETMTWSEIEQSTGSHFVDKEDLIKEARERLIDIEQDDVDQLFSLRVTGVIRIWGIRENEEFHILWCDAKHEICPSPKKHT